MNEPINSLNAINKKTWTIKRTLLTAALVPVIAFALYIVVGLSTYAYLTLSYNRLYTGMTRNQARHILVAFKESQSSPKELSEYGRGVVEGPHAAVYRYDLFGCKWLDGPIFVIYDKRGRMDFAIDAYE